MVNYASKGRSLTRTSFGLSSFVMAFGTPSFFLFSYLSASFLSFPFPPFLISNAGGNGSFDW
ncbi:MAG: hypothetical protein ACTS5F_01780 [Candidatus Hodgkinia cicadicola]